MIASLRLLRGNARGCVYTEPLSGIPYNLYAPYISVFMIALGVSDKQIGLILSVTGGVQLLFALLSGVITDKLGRRRTTLLFDILGWSLPALISALSLNFWYFLAAGLISGVRHVTYNSWACLMVEDTDPDQLIDVYSWIYIAGLLAGFFAPFAGLLVKSFALVPTVRGLYLFASIAFTVKCIATYKMTSETRQGLIRMQETKGQSPLSVLREYRSVFFRVLHTPQTLYTAGIMTLMGICYLISGNFWPILVTERLHIPAQNLALFPIVKSIVMLLFFFGVMPRLRELHFRTSLVAGFLGFALSQFILVMVSEKGYGLLILNIVLEACSQAAISPVMDRLYVITVDAAERARIQSIILVASILIVSPFGLIAGSLSMMDKRYPFILNILLFSLAVLLSYLAGKVSKRSEKVSNSRPEMVVLGNLEAD
jgi:MFS family permease